MTSPLDAAFYADHALQQVDESLRSGVHDPGLLEQLHLLGRVLERSPRRLQRHRQQHREILDRGRALRDVARPVADDRQDGAFDGPGDRRVSRLRRQDDRLAESPRLDTGRVGKPLGEAAEEGSSK